MSTLFPTEEPKCVPANCEYECCIGDNCGTNVFECNRTLIAVCAILGAIMVFVILVIICWKLSRPSSVSAVDPNKDALSLSAGRPPSAASIPSSDAERHEQATISALKIGSKPHLMPNLLKSVDSNLNNTTAMNEELHFHAAFSAAEARPLSASPSQEPESQLPHQPSPKAPDAYRIPSPSPVPAPRTPPPALEPAEISQSNPSSDQKLFSEFAIGKDTRKMPRATVTQVNPLYEEFQVAQASPKHADNKGAIQSATRRNLSARKQYAMDLEDLEGDKESYHGSQREHAPHIDWIFKYHPTLLTDLLDSRRRRYVHVK